MQVSVPALLRLWEHGFDPMMPTSSMAGAGVISPLFAPHVAFGSSPRPSDLDIRFRDEDSEDRNIKFGIGKLALELASDVAGLIAVVFCLAVYRMATIVLQENISLQAIFS